MEDSGLEVVEVTVQRHQEGVCQDVHYAIPVGMVREVVRMPEAIGRVFVGDPSILGLCEIHGVHLPVVNLATALGEPASADLRDDMRLVVVEMRERRVGFLVDSAPRIHSLKRDRFLAREDDLSFVSGLTKLDAGHFLYILDMERLILDLEGRSEETKPVAVEPAPLKEVDVLVIDDTRSIRTGLVTILENEGIGVVEADSGLAGLRLLLKGLRPSLIICDIEMPVMDGLSFTREAKRRADLRDIPIYLFSTLSEEQVSSALKSCGADGFVSKKNPDALLNLIIQRLGNATARDTAAAS